jgi:hypothetical protein
VVRDITHRSTAILGPVTKTGFGVRRTTEVKEYYTNGENNQLYHNASNSITAGSQPLQINPLNALGQGTTSSTRIGDHNFVRNVTVRLWLSNKLDRSNVMYRVIGVFSPSPSSVSAPSFAGVLSQPLGAVNYMLTYPNTEQFTLVYDKIVNPNTFGPWFDWD